MNRLHIAGVDFCRTEMLSNIMIFKKSFSEIFFDGIITSRDTNGNYIIESFEDFCYTFMSEVGTMQYRIDFSFA